MPNMTASMTAFFDQFAQDFPSFDGELIASRYADPYVSVSADGQIQCHTTHQAIAGYFQAVLNDYKRRGVMTCRYHDLNHSAIGDHCQLAMLTWELLDRDDQVVTRWRESYNLIERPKGWRIYASADFSSP